MWFMCSSHVSAICELAMCFYVARMIGERRIRRPLQFKAEIARAKTAERQKNPQAFKRREDDA